MIDVIEIDGNAVTMEGDYFETLIYCSEKGTISEFVEKFIPNESLQFLDGTTKFYQVKTNSSINEDVLQMLSELKEVITIKIYFSCITLCYQEREFKYHLTLVMKC